MSETATTEPAAGPDLRTLILLRHGKADYPGGLRDFDRPLADRGESEAAVAGRWLRATQPPIDAALCSAALRTRQTLAATGIVAATTFTDDIYEASPGEVLAAIRLVSPAVDTLLVVGHSPGMPGLALRLAGPDSDPAVLEELSGRFPTSALAVLQFTGDWSGLEPAGAALSAFHIARD